MKKIKIIGVGLCVAALVAGTVGSTLTGCTSTGGLNTNDLATIDQLAQTVLSNLPAATSNAVAVAGAVQQIQSIAHGSNAPAK